MNPPVHVDRKRLHRNENQVLADVLDHTNFLVDRLVDTNEGKKCAESEANVTAELFRAVNDESGKKRLFVCCDGTWKNASGRSAAAPLTNVARFARAINRFGVNIDDPTSPVAQIVYYSGGVGSQSVLLSGWDSIYSGITGAGRL
jgi:hypothetical protein